MRGPHNIWRLVRTGATFERTGAMRIALRAMDAPFPLRVAARVLGWPFKWLGYRGDPSMPPIPRALTALGPAYIKLGQVLSTRPDVVGSDLSLELRVLQDQLPPFSMSDAKRAIEEEFGKSADDLFDFFDTPIAAASIAQVHRARVKGASEDVAIKILRPKIERAFRKDIDAFYFAAQMIEFFSPGSRRLRPNDVIQHFESVVNEELDLRQEAAAASQFKANTEKDQGFLVPSIRWDLSGKRVMGLGWADGTALGDIEKLRQEGHDLETLGRRVLELFLQHALRDGFFHGDMHHGNLKVHNDGTLIAYDFGIMGHINEKVRRGYAEILYGFIRKDYRRIAEVHFEMGYIPADQDLEAFALALRSVGEPIFGMDASQISMGRLLSHLFEVTERFGMETQTELILLQRTMVVVEGVARSLDPNINIWDVAHPIVEDYIRSSIGPRAAVQDLKKAAAVITRYGPQLPVILEQIFERNLEPNPSDPLPSNSFKTYFFGALGGAAFVGAGVILAQLF
ncbi:MAG: 2-polyprenylphenol 6-hydroxylase [Halocynthiibacter sp.]